MPPTYKALIRADKPPKANGRHTVLIRLTAQRQQLYPEIGIDVRAKDWNEAGTIQKPNWVRAADPQAEFYNQTILKYMLRALQLAVERPTMSAPEFRDRLLGRLAENADSADFLAYFADYVRERTKHGNPRTAERFQVRLNKLKRFRGWVEATASAPEVPPTPLLMSELTPKLIRDYKTYLEQLGNKGQTVPKELGALNTVIRLAVADGKMRHEQNPFLHITLSMPKADKRALTIEEFTRLQNVEWPAEKLTKWHLVSHAAWLLAFYLYGSRVGDVLMLRKRHVLSDRIKWREQKTGKWKEVALFPELRTLLDRFTQGIGDDEFLLPVLDSRQWYFRYPPDMSLDDLEKKPEFRLHLIALYNAIEAATAQFNKAIKKVAALASIEAPHKITTHTARHSFITLSIEGGYDIRSLQGLANHHSIAETERYAHDLQKRKSWGAGIEAYAGINRMQVIYNAHTAAQQTTDSGVAKPDETPKSDLQDSA